jgi:hypothetical protein
MRLCNSSHLSVLSRGILLVVERAIRVVIKFENEKTNHGTAQWKEKAQPTQMPLTSNPPCTLDPLVRESQANDRNSSDGRASSKQHPSAELTNRMQSDGLLTAWVVIQKPVPLLYRDATNKLRKSHCHSIFLLLNRCQMEDTQHSQLSTHNKNINITTRAVRSNYNVLPNALHVGLGL